MKVSFVLLAHEPPELLKPLMSTLLSSGADIFVHYDRNSPYDLASESEEWHLDQYNGKLYFSERIKVVWGEWSIVQATLNCLYLARDNCCTYDYMMLISGSCMPIKPLEDLSSYLNTKRCDFIECVDANKIRWVTDGIQRERWEYYHFVNWRKNRRLFSLSNKFQKIFKVHRKLPQQLSPFIGSQWWCLRAGTIEQLLTFLDDYPQVVRFYRRTWVPDESFFQTLVGNLISADQLNKALLTRYTFNSWGIPRVYYDDNFAELTKDPKFFVRKVSHRASALKCKLSKLAQMSHDEFERACKEDYLPEQQRLKGEQSVDRAFQKNAWNAYFFSNSNECDFLQSIPKQIVVLCSLDQELKIQYVKKLNQSGVMAYADILSEDHIDYGADIKVVAGYSDSSIETAHQYWGHFIGDLAMDQPKMDSFVFTMGEEIFTYLKYFKRCPNVTIVLFDDGSQMPKSSSTRDLLYAFLQRQVFPFHAYNKRVLNRIKGEKCHYVLLSQMQVSSFDIGFINSVPILSSE